MYPQARNLSVSIPDLPTYISSLPISFIIKIWTEEQAEHAAAAETSVQS